MTGISDFDATFSIAKARVLVPQMDVSHPKAKFNEDFILLTEFAEIKHGPQPLVSVRKKRCMFITSFVWKSLTHLLSD